MTVKICKQCNLEKNNFGFSFSKDKLKKWENNICNDCKKYNMQKYCKNNRNKINNKMSEYRKKNSDKIKEHTYFKYSSMEDNSFIECWSLKNLRPLSSKQNLIDGDRR